MPALSRRTESIPLYQGDDEAVIADLRETILRLRSRLDVARKAGPGVLLGGEDDPVAAAERALHEAEAEFEAKSSEAIERAVIVVMRALPWERWDDLVEAHPPREGNKVDAHWDWNTKTLPKEAFPEMLVSPEMAPGEAADFFASLSFGNRDVLAYEIQMLNVGRGASPKERHASEITRT